MTAGKTFSAAQAPDNEMATKVALVMRSFGHATTETWVATPWERFSEMAQKLKR